MLHCNHYGEQKLQDEVETLKQLLAAERTARADAEVKAASAETKAASAVAAATRALADVSGAEALIAHLKLAIEKLRRELYGSRSERGRKLADSQMLDQMELTLEELEAAEAEDEIAAEAAALQKPAARRQFFACAANLCASRFPRICRASG